MSSQTISPSQRRAYENTFSDLNKVTRDQRDQMSPETYLSFCKEYKKLHYILWPSSTLCIPNRMDPKKRQERNKEYEQRRLANLASGLHCD
ncbi:hypothetical protein QKC54_gp1029 [Megavirus baoshan]|uniref:Uncharacterized protein n=1 Tax=Megavirus baoshan TaxID=2496520 RepID=A0A8K1W859_9VIRU|nr:hypothetical protein QKC54_gp1029 [Megavirus baoshan]UFX99717.1 hypothetical protein Mb0043 [Megavirus baoshan]